MVVIGSRLISVATVVAMITQSAIAGVEQYIPRASLASKQSRRAMKIKRQDDAQTSSLLDPSQIQPNQALTGQEDPTVGQVESLTSTNNFINFCLTQDTDLTNGLQIVTGSCNPTPIGRIIATNRMPSSKFTFPINGGTLKVNEPFTIKMLVSNLETGNFVNAQASYYAAPQTVNADGVAIGHSHVVIETIASLDATDVLDNRKFAFFKGLNGVAQDGALTADVTGGLPVGTYKLTSINAAANHQPLLVAVAQHGSLDDCIYFSVTEDGVPAVDPSASASVSAASVSATATSSEVISATATSSEVISATASVVETSTASAIESQTATDEAISAAPTATATSSVTEESSEATSSTSDTATTETGDLPSSTASPTSESLTESEATPTASSEAAQETDNEEIPDDEV